MTANIAVNARPTPIAMSNPIRATPVSLDRITNSILVLRGHRVILDRELAAIYGVPTRRLNEAVKRNSERFPDDFMFQLTGEEAERSRSQIAILNGGRGSNVKYLPHAFTEHGAIQASNILSSPRAVMMGVYVVRAFVQLRQILASHKDLAGKLASLERSLVTLDLKTQRQFKEVYEAIRALMTPPEPRRRRIGFTADLD
ncbi:MAG TPA: ORF6N domain-containing protein [Steroidobacteraceae bacterium]